MRHDSVESSTTLPIRTSTPPTLASRNNSLVGSFSRSESPSRLSLSFARFGRSSPTSPLGAPIENNDDTRTLIVRAFSPSVAVYVSPETDELVRRKGIKNGFLHLVRPFGERISGKVVVRDSTGASRAWEDFGIRFTHLGQLAKDATSANVDASMVELEDVLDQYLQHSTGDFDTGYGPEGMSPYYRHFLERLLVSNRISQHEAFLHPVAAVIAISSATPNPIETLRHMYQQTAQGSHSLPSWANPEYLRYYVLVHDDDRDDFARSSSLFDQMKRHFGLHCHLLRLRSAECFADDVNGEPLPPCEWLTAAEDLAHIQDSAQLIDLEAPIQPSIFSSDAAALRSFVRELVAQSVVPHMEQRISLWNDQIASRRRGISGRFMSLSKRWAGLGSVSRSSSATNITGTSTTGNYDAVQDQYRYDTPEALLRRMADFTMMLRDYKLAASTYELLRTDNSNDKAWKYLAGANEMCCAATLLNPLASGSTKLKIETFDQMIETASYSYFTRCSHPFLALRAILLGVELLKVRGPTANDIATKWATRVLQMNILGSAGHVLVTERVVSSLASQIGVGPSAWGTRKRKAAMWSVMAADEWMKLGKTEFAASKLTMAAELYAETKHGNAIKEYGDMAEFMRELELAVKIKLNQARRRGLSGASQPTGDEQFDEDDIEETTENMEQLDTKPNRKSLMGAGNPLEGMAPQSPVRLRADPFARDDDFE